MTPDQRLLPLGVSTSVFGGVLTELQLDALDASGLECVEAVVTAHDGWLAGTETAAQWGERLRRGRVRFHSMHLPSGRQLDLSQTDEAARSAALAATEANVRHWLPGCEGGVVDWPAFVGALRSVGYTGPFLYEVRTYDGPPAEALRLIEDNYARLILPLIGATQV